MVVNENRFPGMRCLGFLGRLGNLGSGLGGSRSLKRRIEANREFR